MIGKRWIIGCWIVAMGGCLMACAPQAVREAQSVVAQADSLWHAGKQYGIDEGDSATLAQACETLGQWQWLHADEYAHTCYHYGKLLRAKEHPVEAMQAFISATHSGTKDYHILGRVYNNMGDICHLASEFQLSYDMFEQSTDYYLKSNDSLLYCYARNDMAFELAEQGKKDSCFSITKGIIVNSADSVLIAFCYMSQAQACLRCKQYDSVIVYAYKSKYHYPSMYFGAMQLAQAYSHIGNKDSAAYYANKVLATSHALSDINNALYILTNDDETKNLEAVRQTAADRADIHKLLAIRQGELSQAIQLLEQDLTREPDLRWLYAIIATLVIAGGMGTIIVQHKRKKKELLSQQINDLTILNKVAEEQQAILTQNIGNLSQLHNAHHEKIIADIEQFCKLIQSEQDLQDYLHWKNFTEMCALSNKYLYNIITKLQPYNLSQKEIRLCILVLLNANTNQMVNMIPYAKSGLGKFKYTTSNKLGTTTPNLRTFLLGLLG